MRKTKNLNSTFKEKNMISTHILDTQKGIPAKDVRAKLFKFVENRWNILSENVTNEDGRINFNIDSEEGRYKISFDLEEYYHWDNQEYFFPKAEIEFLIKDTNRKYHVPLLLNPYGYTTYRGS